MSLQQPARRKSDVALLAVLAAAAVASCSVATVVVVTGSRQPGLVSSVLYVTSPRRIDASHDLFLLHRVGYHSPGGQVSVHWYDSDFEPVHPNQYAIVSIYVDGERVASTVKGSQAGTYEDGEGDLVWHGALPRGHHVIEVKLDSARLRWGLPYTDPGRVGSDGLAIMSQGRNAH
jgi:hypothetical protein